MLRFRILILAFVVGITTLTHAQQVPQFSMYLWNNYLINPAVGGADNSMDLKFGYRNQWVNLDGAPRTMYLTFHTQIGKRLDNDEHIDVPKSPADRRPLTGFHRLMGVKRKKAAAKPPTNYKERGHHGVGFQILNDRIGVFNVNVLLGSYAYHLPLGNKTYASLGANFGLKNYVISGANTYVKNDPTIEGAQSRMAPDGTMGGLIYSDKYYVGLAIDQIMNNKMSVADIETAIKGRLSRHYFIYGGYKLPLPSRDIAVVPSVMVRVLPNTRPSIDLNGKFNYMDLIWFGVSYRHLDSFIGMMGLHFNNQWDIGYSYDFTTSELSKYNNGTHEIVVGYRLVNKKGLSCRPSYIW